MLYGGLSLRLEKGNYMSFVSTWMGGLRFYDDVLLCSVGMTLHIPRFERTLVWLCLIQSI